VLGDAAQSLGARLATGYGATDRNGGENEGRRGLVECGRFARENQRALVRPLVALHASFTVSNATVQSAGALCSELGVPMHVHLAEDQADVDDAKQRGFPGPLERLMQLGALPRGSILAHGVFLTEEQVRVADTGGLWLVQNPRSNAGNRVGFARALEASAHVALGTDGYPADMRAEQDALGVEAERAGHALGQDAIALYRAAGYALVSQLFGAAFQSEIARGSPADLVVWSSAEDAASTEARPRHVIVLGEVVVENGRLTRGDLETIRAHAREQAPKLWERMGEIR
jgi:cytosine/adenosine deaminase-related metal-dependent hydrolase